MGKARDSRASQVVDTRSEQPDESRWRNVLQHPCLPQQVRDTQSMCHMDTKEDHSKHL